MKKSTVASFITIVFCLCHAHFLPAQNIGINSSASTGQPAALLDLNTGNTFTSPNGKGFILPNEYLTAINVSTPLVLTTADTSILVYNKKSAGLIFPGFYFWKGAGTAWLQLGAGSGWFLTGNAGTNPGFTPLQNFIGTTSNTQLLFGVNDKMSGELNSTGIAIWGYQNGISNTSNCITAIGYEALMLNTTGSGNTAIGYQALENNTTGYDNTVAGSIEALQANTTGYNNTVLGYLALKSNAAGYDNTAIGDNVEDQNTLTGARNTILGRSSFPVVTSGSSNTAIGEGVANNCTSITASVLVGQSAGNKNGLCITILGAGSGNTSMNYTTVGGDNSFNANSTVLYQGTGNTGIGENTGTSDTSGSYNVFIGAHAGQSTTTGNANTLVGRYAGQAGTSTSGTTGTGYCSIYHNTGNNNTFSGWQVLDSNTTGANNTSFGHLCLRYSTLGSNSTVMGFEAMQYSTTGSQNTTTGYQAIQKNTTGFNNTAIGYRCLYSDTKATSNTAAGNQAGVKDTNGSFNVFIGDSSGYQNTFGAQNTFAGSQAGTTLASASYTNVTGIGYQCPVYTTVANNSINLGNLSITHVCAQVGAITTYSDRRIKEDIKNNVPGSSFINNLHPVTYHINVDRENTLLGNNFSGQSPYKYDVGKILYSGFIAQQVDSAAMACGYNFCGLDKPAASNNLYSLGYTYFVVPLVKVVQERQEAIDSMKEANTILLANYNKLKDLLSKMEQSNTERHKKNQADIALLKEMLKQYQYSKMLTQTNKTN